MAVLMVLGLSSWFAFAPSRVCAQADSFLVVAESDVPRGLTRMIKRKLAQVGEILDSDEYIAAARAEGLAPASEAAVTRLATRSGAKIIVRVEVDERRSLTAEFRSGSDGTIVVARSFGLKGQRLQQPARVARGLTAAASDALSQVHLRGAAVTGVARGDAESNPTVAEAVEGADEPVLDDEDASEAVAHSSSEAPASASEGEQIMEDPELTERLQASSSSEQPPDAPRDGLALRASVGIGPGVHALRVPAPSAENDSGEVDTGLAPVIQLAGAAQLGIGHWLLRAEAQYRTFFAVAPAPVPADPVDPNDPGAMSDPSSMADMTMSMGATSPVSSHSLVIGASPGYRFGGDQSVALLVMLGWTFRSLNADVAKLPSATFTGFVARPTLQIPLGQGAFCLRLAPEFISVRSSESNALGFMATRSSGGTGFGAEASLDMRLAQLLLASIEYRYSRVSLARVSGAPAVDKEWYVTVQAVLSL